MNTTIWKFQLSLTGMQVLGLPEGARILSVGDQEGTLALWAEVDPDAPRSERSFVIVGTGHEIPSLPARWHLQFIGTVVGPLVWHVYEMSWM